MQGDDTLKSGILHRIKRINPSAFYKLGGIVNPSLITYKEEYTMTNTTKKPFAWDEKNESVIADAYAEQKAIDHAKANSKEWLGELAKKVGAKSAQAVRSKLSNMKVYEAIETTASTGGKKARITKPMLAEAACRAITDSGVTLKGNAGDTLANANVEALNAVIAAFEQLTGNSYAPTVEEAPAPRTETAKA